MWQELIGVNLIKTVPVLRMPVFFFLGRHDRVVVQGTSVAYYDVLQAPPKTLIWFEKSGHNPAGTRFGSATISVATAMIRITSLSFHDRQQLSGEIGSM